MKNIAQIVLGHLLVPAALFFVWKVELVIHTEDLTGQTLANGFFTIEWIVAYHTLMYILLLLSLVSGVQLSRDGYRKLHNEE
jgi:uncharacterized membrane protein YjgN (DUF898 family)